MGHLQELKREYRDLADRLGTGTVGLPEPENEKAREGWREILEILYTPEEAALASRLPVLPKSIKDIARRVGLTIDELRPRLEAMAEKGLVLDLPRPDSSEDLYLLAPPVVGFFEFSMMRANDMIPKKRMAQAMEAYFWEDTAFVQEVFGHETQIGRTLVHEDAIAEESAEVLDWERARAIVRGARTRAVSLCYCRHKAGHLGKSCGVPVETCLSLDGAAEFVLRRGFGRKIDASEAAGILDLAREKRLVHIADNVKRRPSWICNCCACCCGQLQAVNRVGLPAVTPSGFEARNRPETCTGCSRCARVCPAGAIAMAPVRKGAAQRNGLLPEVDYGRCLGCGVCAEECPKRSMRMHRRSKRPAVPFNGVEKALRMALERGRLPHLLFDAAAGPGPKALNALLQALCRFPPVEKALASEQVRSRFVRFVLKRVPSR